ncbi:hypothetical protein RFI_38923, partial [Reticulomyxa filosa]
KVKQYQLDISRDIEDGRIMNYMLPHHRQNKEESKKEDEKKQELNDDNIWKERNVKVHRDYFCRISPTLVITLVDGRLLKSSSSVLELFGENVKQLATKIKAHTFSQTWRTLF